MVADRGVIEKYGITVTLGLLGPLVKPIYVYLTMDKKKGILSWLFGGFSLFKVKFSFKGLRFWKVRRPGRKPDIDVKP